MGTAISHNLSAHIFATARAFRLGMEGVGSERLAEFIDALGCLLPKVSPDVLEKLNPLLEDTFNAMSRKDHLRVADLLEYEIKPLVDSRKGDTLKN